jgi:hypothetical protein
MTLLTTTDAHRRTRPIREHAYTIPVVRELPPQPADPPGAQSLW